MAFKGRRVTVTDEPTALLSGTSSAGAEAVLIRNRGAASVDLGGDDVVFGAGYELGAGEIIDAEILRREGPYAIAADGTTVRVDVLENGA